MRPARAAARGMVRRWLPQRLVQRVARTARAGSAVSVVVVVTESDASYLGTLIADLGRQSAPAEVLLVPVGDEAASEVGRHARAGWRVQILEPVAEVGRAVELGVREATGERLLVLGAGDRMRRAGLADLVEALDRSGGDIAGATPCDIGRRQLGDVMFRRSLWDRVRPRVVEAPYATWLACAELVMAASRCVEAPSPRQGGRARTGSAFGAMPVLAPYVDGWANALLTLLGRLSGGRASSPVLVWAIEEELARYLEDAERCSPGEWDRLSQVAARLLRSASADLLAELGVEARVRARLAAGGHRSALEAFNAARWLQNGQFETGIGQGGVTAALPVDPELLEPGDLTLGSSETPLIAELRRLRWHRDEIEVEVLATIEHVPGDRAEVVLAWHSDDGERLTVDVARSPDPEANIVVGDRFTDHSGAVVVGRVRAEDLARARGELSERRWHLEVAVARSGVRRSGTVERVDSRGSAATFPARQVSGRTIRVVDGGLGLVASCRAQGMPPDGDGPVGCLVTDLDLDGDVLTLRGTTGSDAKRLRVRLAGAYVTDAVPVAVTDREVEVRLALAHAPWGGPLRPLPSGGYRVEVLEEGGEAASARPAEAVAARLPLTLLSGTFRLRVRRAHDGALLISLAAPLTDEEVGPFAQQQLQCRYRATDRAIDPSLVYLQSYTGQHATDSPLAIHHALRRLRPDLELCWGIADRSSSVPEGARGVLFRSREWYDVLATAGWIVTNVDMEPWFTKRNGQRLLQTFHGYPSKTMGIASWEAKNFTPLRIERLLRRTSATWDLLLTPNEEMTKHYRREYRYGGPALAEGYPRDDVLVGPRTESIRAATRSRLGIPEGARVVLHAPTWRDDLATNFRAAEAGSVFDAERAAIGLGEGYVVLLRGHRFHRRRAPTGSSRLLDVTDYPEINDLVLACDAAVLDYSSLRFDLALAGRPMIFLVPDLDRYEKRVRGFLYDFASSAPGPRVDTTDQVVERLRDLDDLRTRCAPDLRRFNEEYNSHQDGHAADRAVGRFFGDAREWLDQCRDGAV
jgi:CDP-glycerol glycerophosphotransferase (TagB/SpsB family)